LFRQGAMARTRFQTTLSVAGAATYSRLNTLKQLTLKPAIQSAPGRVGRAFPAESNERNSGWHHTDWPRDNQPVTDEQPRASDRSAAVDAALNFFHDPG